MFKGYTLTVIITFWVYKVKLKRMHYLLGWAPQKDGEEQTVGLAKLIAWLMYSKGQQCTGSERL